MKTTAQNPNLGSFDSAKEGIEIGDMYTDGKSVYWKDAKASSMQLFNKATGKYLTPEQEALASDMVKAFLVFQAEDKSLVPGDLSGISNAALEAATGINAAGVRNQHLRAVIFDGYNHLQNGERWEDSYHRHIATAHGKAVVVGNCRCAGL